MQAHTRDLHETLINRYGEKVHEKLCAYMNGIIEANKHINLTTITEETEFLEKHIIDSLSCDLLPEFRDSINIADMGTGAGFPGIPLAIAYPEKEFLLIDSLAKRLNIIDGLSAQIGINNVKTYHVRAEDIGQDLLYREKFDLCLSRAVAYLNVLAEWCLPLVKKRGAFVAYKGGKAAEELENSQTAIKRLGGRYLRTEYAKYGSEIMSSHALIIIKKEKTTPANYPRKPGEAKKNPI